jgi:hypothetical protein
LVTAGVTGGGGRRLAGGALLSAGKREKRVTVRDCFLLGCGLDPLLGQNGFRGPVIFLFSSFSFSFSAFLFLSYILHKCFKSNQTNFHIPQIFKTTF